MIFHSADLLVGLMSFSEKHYHIALLSVLYAVPDSLPAVIYLYIFSVAFRKTYLNIVVYFSRSIRSLFLRDSLKSISHSFSLVNTFS